MPPPTITLKAKGKDTPVTLNMASLSRIEEASGQSVFEILQQMISLTQEGQFRFERLKLKSMRAIIAGAIGCPVDELDDRMEMAEVVPAFLIVGPALSEAVSQMMPSGDDETPPSATEASGA